MEQYSRTEIKNIEMFNSSKKEIFDLTLKGKQKIDFRAPFPVPGNICGPVGVSV